VQQEAEQLIRTALGELRRNEGERGKGDDAGTDSTSKCLLGLRRAHLGRRRYGSAKM
jgi:hypothetical protein